MDPSFRWDDEQNRKVSSSGNVDPGLRRDDEQERRALLLFTAAESLFPNAFQQP
jgi:hypothetical protein